MTSSDEDDAMDDSTTAHRPRASAAVDTPQEAFATTVPGTGVHDSVGAVTLASGTTVGRYVILRPLGAGGFGCVYAAYDGELERRVAIKLLIRTTSDPEDAARERKRMMREAKALARLAHPNVVTVHDVGVHDGQVYVAMEHVDGEILRAWVGEPRPWQNVLDVIIALGDGIVAAHEAGVLHTDVKPDNAILGNDGRVRLVDFGLARAHDAPVTDAGLDLPRSQIADEGSSVATTFGWAAGTPGYMPPEQYQANVGPAADQFALCVTAWELLYGARPWRAATREALLFSMGAQQPSVREGVPEVPAWLRATLERGLQPEVEDRFPDVATLVSTLRTGRTRQRRRRRIVLAMGGAVLVAGLVGAHQVGRWQQRRACERAGDEVYTLWNDERREALGLALRDSGMAYGEDAATRGTPAIDAYVESWAAARTEGCVRAEVTGAWDTDTASRSVRCLDVRRHRLAAWLDGAEADPAAAALSFVVVATKLSPVDPCLDPVVLKLTPQVPPELQSDVWAVQDAVAGVIALEDLGKLDDARIESEALLARAREIGWGPLIAQTGLTLANVLNAVGEFEAVEAVAEDTYFVALADGAMADTAAEAAELMVLTVGDRLGRWREAERWLRAAEAACAHAMGDLAVVARLEMVRGHVDSGNGKYIEALVHYQKALDRWVELLGSEHPIVATSMQNVGNTLTALGRNRDAIAMQTRAVAIVEAVFGPHHPEVADGLQNLTFALMSADEYTEARPIAERTLEIRRETVGEDAALTVQALTNLAVLEARSGDLVAAVDTEEHVVEWAERRFGPDHPNTADDLSNLAVMQQQLGQAEEAIDTHRRVLEIRTRVYGPEHPEVGTSHINLGTALQAAGRHEDARAEFEVAVRVLAAAQGETSFILVHPLAGLAESSLALGDVTSAISNGERAVALAEQEGASQEARAFARFTLAAALWAVEGDGPPPGKENPDAKRHRDRALKLARQARELFAEPGGQADGVDAVDAWATRVGADL